MSVEKESRNFFEQREFVRSLVEQLEIEKSILEELEPDENSKEAEIAYSLAEELICPISYSFMVDPVFLSSGKTYERSAINTEEVTNVIIPNPNLNPPNPQPNINITKTLTPVPHGSSSLAYQS